MATHMMTSLLMSVSCSRTVHSALDAAVKMTTVNVVVVGQSSRTELDDDVIVVVVVVGAT